jgi:hypothetical protein
MATLLHPRFFQINQIVVRHVGDGESAVSWVRELTRDLTPEKRVAFNRLMRATNGYFAHDTVCVLFDLFFRHARGIAVAREGITPGLTRGFAVFEICGEGARSFLGAKYTSI